MAMHHIFGLSIGEWASVITTCGVFFSGIAYLVRKIIMDPIRKDMKASHEESKHENELTREVMNNLADKVRDIGGNADTVHKEHDRRLDQHDVHLMKHDEEIKTLFERTDRKE